MTEENIEKTPGQKALEEMQSLEINTFKKPTSVVRKRKKQKILDDDTYVEQIGKIIQRDFFPDLEKLKAQNDYLEALDKNDTIKLRELYVKYSERRPLTERIASPATFETPANLHNSQVHREETDVLENVDNNSKREKHLSLDQYLNSHTSQDNESFQEILVESEKKHRHKFSYLYNEEERSAKEQDQILALPSLEQQCALPEKKLNVDTWGYKNKNYIMYIPDGVELTKEQELEINKKRQQVVHANTRLTVNPFNENQSKETINELAKTQAKVLDGKIGVDGKELLKSETPKIGGFSLIRDPSPCPGAMGSPLMTWGEIEGTPFRLDGSDTPLPRSQGPSFKIAEPPRREQIALALAEKVGEKNRDQKRRTLSAQRRQFESSSPRPSTSSIDRLATMSPAARKLATSRLKLGVNSDLLASYSPSPNRAKTPTTPRRISTPKVNILIKKSVTEVSTDDLLKISLPKRKKASDFF